ncbi:hypothetical protein LPJ54_006488, partial [Coemansia sp. RSA 1824]
MLEPIMASGGFPAHSNLAQVDTSATRATTCRWRSGAGPPQHTCPTCLLTCTSSYTLRMHMRVH